MTTEDDAALIERLCQAGLVHVDARVLAAHLVRDADDEDPTRAQRRAALVLEAIEEGRMRAQTSSLSLYQIAVEPYRRREPRLAREVGRGLELLPNLAMVSTTPAMALQAAEIRAQLGGRSERAVQLATALVAGAELYVTVKSGLRRIAGMQVVDLSD